MLYNGTSFYSTRAIRVIFASKPRRVRKIVTIQKWGHAVGPGIPSEPQWGVKTTLSGAKK